MLAREADHVHCSRSGTLQDAQVKHEDLIMVIQRQPAPQAQRPQQQPAGRNQDGSLQNPQAFLDAVLSNPASMAQFPPNLRDAISTGDIDTLQGVFRALRRQEEAERAEAQLVRPGEDPMDPAVQVC